MPSTSPKDHYVPQFYLDAFAKEEPGIKNPHIYQYMKNKVVVARIKDVASEKNYYTFADKKTGGPNRDIDNFFTQIETNASNPLKKIIKQENINLSNEERAYIAAFIAILVVRTPGFIKSLESFEGEAIKEFSALEAMNINRLRKMFEEAKVKVSDNQLKEAQEFIIEKKYKIDFPNSKAYFLGKGLKYAVEFADLYYRVKHWHLLIADYPMFFVTSDNPITVYRPIFIPPAYNAGYGNGTLVLPISPRLAILLRDLPLKHRIYKLNAYFVNKFNINIIRFADNYIFANNESQPVYRKFRTKHRKEFQKAKVTRMTWAPFIFMGSPPVPEEIIKV